MHTNEKFKEKVMENINKEIEHKNMLIEQLKSGHPDAIVNALIYLLHKA